MLPTTRLRFAALAAGLAALTAAAGAPAQDKKAPPKKAPEKRPVAQPDDLALPPGFQAELLYTADPGTEGSWINLAVDNKGRLIIAGQQNQPILRATLKDGKVAKMEPLGLPITQAMGLLYAFDSLYVVGNGPGAGYGLFRCKDTDGDDKFDDIKVLKDFKAGGEHGAHAVAVGPDGKLWVCNGNHTPVPEGLSKTSPHRNYREDHLLPRQWDGNGHATGILAPGGYVLRTDPDGKEWEMHNAGFRNQYDFAFNGDGELFTWDSDMEWDWGMPWYRPTRVNHCVSGGESGWRSGTGKWPAYYPDSLPPVVNIGVGSPTGVTFGTGAKFPAKYQKAFYICDWTYGRLIAVHLQPDGASYKATFENLVAPKGLDGKSTKKPLPLSDVVVGQDGAMYFTIGGRNNQSALYRVTYTGSESTAPADLANKDGADARKLRRELEAFHREPNPKAVAFAWPHLNSDDRYIRYAARVAVEAQPVAEWKSKALAEANPNAAITALLALARNGESKDLPDLLTAAARFPLSKLSESQKLDKLRLLGLAFTRLGRPSADHARKLIAEIDPLFPASSDEAFNREAAQVLIYLNSPTVLSKCLKLMADAKTQEDRLHYLFHLRTLPVGYWTLDQRKEYLGYFTSDWAKMSHPPELVGWFKDAGRDYGQGSSFNNFLKNFVREFAANLSADEWKELQPLIAKINDKATVAYEAKQRPFVKKWATADLAGMLDKVDRGRNFEGGRQAFLDAACAKCHRMGDFGGGVGPDLTSVGSRFDRRAVLESIVDPSKVVSEQYQNETFQTATGTVVTGRVVDETADAISVQPDPLDPKRVTIKKADIDARKASPVSPMPAGLADGLSADDILDLIAYMESGGRKQYKAFQK